MADLIHISLPKGYIQLLTSAEYAAGLRRGKAIRRREAFDARMVKLGAERIAGKLGKDDTQVEPCHAGATDLPRLCCCLR